MKEEITSLLAHASGRHVRLQMKYMINKVSPPNHISRWKDCKALTIQVRCMLFELSAFEMTGRSHPSCLDAHGRGSRAVPEPVLPCRPLCTTKVPLQSSKGTSTIMETNIMYKERAKVTVLSVCSGYRNQSNIQFAYSAYLPDQIRLCTSLPH